MDRKALLEAVRELRTNYPVTDNDVHDDAWVAGFSDALDQVVDLIEGDSSDEEE